MATVKISELPAILGANTATTDVLPIVDVSGNITNKITREEFFKNIQTDVEIADKIVHSGDTNTAIRFPAADTVTVETSGAERLRITDTGFVGLGTASPGARLEVTGEIRIYPSSGAANLRFGSGGAEKGKLAVDASSNMAFETAGTERMRIDSSGNVGIGTTSPSYALSVARNSSSEIAIQAVNAGIGQATLRLQNSLRHWAIFVDDGASGPLRFYDYTAGSERLRITDAGFVGIGSTAPVVSLHVVGDTMTTGVVYMNQPAQTSKAAAATLTIAELETGIIQYTGAAATLTLPTGTLIEGGVPASFPVNMAFDFSVINTGSGTATLGTATGLTLVGSMAVTAGVSGMFRVRKTATNTYTVYRIG